MKLPLLAALAATVSFPALAQNALELGRERSESFLAGELEPIWEDMTPQMQTALGSLEAFADFREQLETDLGEEETLIAEETAAEGELTIYLRTADWSKAETTVLMQWAFDGQGDIAGFFVRPQPVAAESPYLDYRTKADLRLTFTGEWYVFWGGREIEDNYHAADPAQRFAYDFVVRENGQSYSGDAEQLESYHCWGREILAPADGQVIATVDDLPDLPIGQTDPQNPAGNHVILALGNEEFAFLAHLQQASITVQQGEEVEQGDVLGLCGNSGNTSEPHLHFHLQTTPDLRNGLGLPAQFTSYLAGGEPVARGEPEQGQTIAPASE